MTTIEKQIEKHKEELTCLENIKEQSKNSLFNKTMRIVLESGFSDWSGQKIDDIKVKECQTYYGNSVRISMPIGYATFNLIDDLHQEGLFITQVTTYGDKELAILVTDEEGINFMRAEDKRNE